MAPGGSTRKGLTHSKEACREKEPSKSLHGRGGKASLSPGKMTKRQDTCREEQAPLRRRDSQDDNTGPEVSEVASG